MQLLATKKTTPAIEAVPILQPPSLPFVLRRFETAQAIFPGKWWEATKLESTNPTKDPYGYAQFDAHAWGCPERRELRPTNHFHILQRPAPEDRSQPTVTVNSASLFPEDAWQFSPLRQAPNERTTIADTLLDYAERTSLSYAWKCLKAVPLISFKGHEFMLFILGSREHERLDYWKNLYQDEPSRLRELFLAADPLSHTVIGGLRLSFSNNNFYGDRHIGLVRLDGLGDAPCGVNSSFGINPSFRDCGFGKTLMALVIQRSREILADTNGCGLLGHSIDTGPDRARPVTDSSGVEHFKRNPLPAIFDKLGFTDQRPVGHGGTSVEIKNIPAAGLAWLEDHMPTHQKKAV